MKLLKSQRVRLVVAVGASVLGAVILGLTLGRGRLQSPVDVGASTRRLADSTGPVGAAGAVHANSGVADSSLASSQQTRGVHRQPDSVGSDAATWTPLVYDNVGMLTNNRTLRVAEEAYLQPQAIRDTLDRARQFYLSALQRVGSGEAERHQDGSAHWVVCRDPAAGTRLTAALSSKDGWLVDCGEYGNQGTNKRIQSIRFYDDGKIKNYTMPEERIAVGFSTNGSLEYFNCKLDADHVYSLCWTEDGSLIRQKIRTVEEVAEGRGTFR